MLEIILNDILSRRNEKNIEGMKRFGIDTNNTIGIGSQELYAIAKKIGKNHELAVPLWRTGYHETRFIAAMIADPKLADRKLIDEWVNDFDNWAICDSVCGKFIEKVSFAESLIPEWVLSEKEYVRRTAFTMIAWIAVHRKKYEDSHFNQYFDLIYKYSTDPRNYVYKAVNWALRQIGKRNINLARKAIEASERIINDFKGQGKASWIARDAIRELKGKFFL